MNQSGLSPKELKIVLLIRAGVTSFRGLNTALGNSPGSTGWISQYLRELREAGLVTWAPGQARTLQLTEAGRRALRGYCLMPGGGIGTVERVGNANE